MKKISGLFLSLVIFLVLVHPLSASDQNLSTYSSGVRLLSPLQTVTNIPLKEIQPTNQLVAASVDIRPAISVILPSDISQPFPANSSQGTLLTQGNLPGNVYSTVNSGITRGAYTLNSTVASSPYGKNYASDRLIVRFKSPKSDEPAISSARIEMAHAKVGAKVKKDFSSEGVSGLQVVQLPNGTDVQSAVKEYQSNPDVLYAEPDYFIAISPDQARPVVQGTKSSANPCDNTQ